MQSHGERAALAHDDDGRGFFRAKATGAPAGLDRATLGGEFGEPIDTPVTRGDFVRRSCEVPKLLDVVLADGTFDAINDRNVVAGELYGTGVGETAIAASCDGPVLRS